MFVQLSQYKLGKLPGDGAESVRINGEADVKDGAGEGTGGSSVLNNDTVSTKHLALLWHSDVRGRDALY